MVRVDYADTEDLPEEYQALIVSSLQPGKTVNVYRAIGNNPPVLQGLREYLGATWTDSGLTDRQRELVILTVSKTLDSEYEWHQHKHIAEDAGVEPAEMNAISEGSYGVFQGSEEALIEYVVAVVEGRVTDALHEQLSEYADESMLVGAAALAAGYLALARIIDALNVDIEEGDSFVGWGV